jgi:hypothetical protein
VRDEVRQSDRWGAEAPPSFDRAERRPREGREEPRARRSRFIEPIPSTRPERGRPERAEPAAPDLADDLLDCLLVEDDD